MSNVKKRKISKGLILSIIGSLVLLAMIGVVVSGLWYKRQCDIIYNEVNSSVVRSGMKIYAQYDQRTVEIAPININRVINSVTNPMVLFTSEEEMPDVEPVILCFGDELLMEVYPSDEYEVFVKHETNKKTKYYIIENTCNFKNLKKMVSLDEWTYPNILVEN